MSAKLPFSGKVINFLAICAVSIAGYLIAESQRIPGQSRTDALASLPIWLKVGLPLLVISPFARTLINWRVSKHEASQQIVRDAQARSIFEQLQAGERPRFALYLRSFWFDGPGAEYSESIDGSFQNQRQRNYDHRLANLIDVPLISIGQVTEKLGSGKIEATDLTWQRKVELLANHASIILIIPLHTAGTRWEVEMLAKSQLLGKTIFVMPGSDEVDFRKSEIALRWAAAVRDYRFAGWRFPEYRPNQMFSIRPESAGEMSANKLPFQFVNWQMELIPNERSAFGEACARLFLSDEERRRQQCLPSQNCPQCGAQASRWKRKVNGLSLTRRQRTCAQCRTVYHRPDTRLTALVDGLLYLLFAAAMWGLTIHFGSFLGDDRGRKNFSLMSVVTHYLVFAVVGLVALGFSLGALRKFWVMSGGLKSDFHNPDVSRDQKKTTTSDGQETLTLGGQE